MFSHQSNYWFGWVGEPLASILAVPSHRCSGWRALERHNFLSRTYFIHLMLREVRARVLHVQRSVCASIGAPLTRSEVDTWIHMSTGGGKGGRH